MKVFALALFVVLLFPTSVGAEDLAGTCSKTGYTVATINGVFTDEDGAEKNLQALYRKLGKSYNGERVNFHYFHNPSHIAGLGDALKSIEQKVVQYSKVEDYDLIEMLKDASAKVETQKLLLVPHSQGNFYANSFYDEVTKEGGIVSRVVPEQSIAIYSVANPSGRVAGVEKPGDEDYLTSGSDEVIAIWVTALAGAAWMKTLEPNDYITLGEGDDAMGHNFREVYLKYRGKKIVENILFSLEQLQPNAVQTESERCIENPKGDMLSVGWHKVKGAALTVADPVASVTKTAVVGTAKGTWWVGTKVVDGLSYVRDQTARGVWWTAGKAVDGLAAVGNGVKDGYDWSVNKVADGVVATYDYGKDVAQKTKEKVSDFTQSVQEFPSKVKEKIANAIEEKTNEIAEDVEQKAEERVHRTCMAEAAYASEDTPELTTLRSYRDNIMAESQIGNMFVQEYYKLSPPVAEYLETHPRVRQAVQMLVFEPMVAALTYVEK